MEQMLPSATLCQPSINDTRRLSFVLKGLYVQGNGRIPVAPSHVPQCCGGTGQGASRRTYGTAVALLTRGAPRRMMRKCYLQKPLVWLLNVESFRMKLPLRLAMCHGDLEITSTKELADGSLHFSFGAASYPGTSNKAEELSSLHAEHIASGGLLKDRLPSQFRRLSPIPVSARERKVRHPGGPRREATGDAVVPERTNDAKKNNKFPPRPPSSFVKRSPITASRKKAVQSEPSMQDLGLTTSFPMKTQFTKSPCLKYESNGGPLKRGDDESYRSSENQSPSQKNPIDNVKESTDPLRSVPGMFNAIDATRRSERPLKDQEKSFGTVRKGLPLRSVRKSPVPQSTIKRSAKSVLGNTHLLTHGSAEISNQRPEKSGALKSPRPKTNFVRRSPITSHRRREISSAKLLKANLIHRSSTTKRRRDISSMTTVKSEVVVDNAGQNDSSSTYLRLEAHGDGTDDASTEMASVGDTDVDGGLFTGGTAGIPSKDEVDLSKYKLLELKNMAKSWGLKGYSRLKKGELIDLLSKLKN